MKKMIQFKENRLPNLRKQVFFGHLLGFFLLLGSMTLSAQSNFDFVGSLNLVEGNEAIKVLKTELRQIVTSSTYAAKDVGLSPTGNLSNGLLEEVFLTKSIETIAEGKTTVEAINITGNAMVDQGHPLESIQLLIANLLLKLN